MKTLVDGDQDTICALSTPPGIGGISVIRISGPQSVFCLKKLLTTLPFSPESHRVYYGFLVDRNLEKMDEVLSVYFESERSFTGEDVVEISCHGSPYIVEKILKELVFLGCRLAQPGEFTYRAFMNGRIDLLQAESVLALVHSRNKSAADLALRNLSGILSKEILKLEDGLIWCLAHIESNIDFTSEGLDLLPRDLVIEKLKATLGIIYQLLKSFSFGRICNEGLNITIVGKPNVGKSTLFNLLLQEDRAIVTDIPGTTRDLLESSVVYKGIMFNFLDTAGLREGLSDPIEKIGIERTRKKILEAEFVVLVLDLTQDTLSSDECALIQNLSLTNSLILFNKSDLFQDAYKKTALLSVIEPLLTFEDSRIDRNEFLKNRTLEVSAQQAFTRELILEKIHSFVNEMGRDNEGLAIFNSRQYEYLKIAEPLILETLSLLEQGIGEEILSIPLKAALLQIQKMHGTYYEDQVLDRVFKEFCIGK